MVINAQNVAGMILLSKACAETFEMVQFYVLNSPLDIYIYCN